ncbi:hypothetical protein [Burkholderia sp. Ax-1719]|uniref:hypothetical protein n=1 Tax=Burkholderia sp. Ax-1719 TaxID=2608334 RepID=UPI0014205D3F|nr:hypothetical protein [Burkholderia sp. Ax-1719]NIE67436.1 hypothetical protein [Burkholderia sp. Ax-1719]
MDTKQLTERAAEMAANLEQWAKLRHECAAGVEEAGDDYEADAPSDLAAGLYDDAEQMSTSAKMIRDLIAALPSDAAGAQKVVAWVVEETEKPTREQYPRTLDWYAGEIAELPVGTKLYAAAVAPSAAAPQAALMDEQQSDDSNNTQAYCDGWNSYRDGGINNYAPETIEFAEFEQGWRDSKDAEPEDCGWLDIPSASEKPRAPFSNCSFSQCDLPGQCAGEGACHHPAGKVAPQMGPLTDVEITACALMIKGICMTIPRADWSTKIEERIRFMLKSATTPAERVSDAARLDWLDATNARFKMGWRVGRAPAGNVSVSTVIQLDGDPTPIRAAIDEARKVDIERAGDAE